MPTGPDNLEDLVSYTSSTFTPVYQRGGVIKYCPALGHITCDWVVGSTKPIPAPPPAPPNEWLYSEPIDWEPLLIIAAAFAFAVFGIFSKWF